jgi:pyruvate-ferredoxin/flavodoxin oxidoreductase
MGSSCDAIEETIDYLAKKGEKVGLVKVHLFRPFSAEHFVAALPATVKTIAVLDRTKEPGSLGEPLYEDVRTAIGEIQEAGKSQFKSWPTVVGGRYGLGSNEFTPAMVMAVYENLKAKTPKNKFTIGIYDDVTNSSLKWDLGFSIESDDVNRALFYGLGSDGTVGANKNSIKIIGDATALYPQGYFVYNSKKAGTITVSHVRFGPKPIKSSYLISDANFVACHKYSYIEKVDMLSNLKKGGVFLLNSPFHADKIWDELPVEMQKQIIDKEAKFYVINATKIAEECGMGNRTNVIMQTAYFKISGVLPEAQALDLIKQAIVKTYSKKGQDVVDANIKTVDVAAKATELVNYPKTASSKKKLLSWVPADAPKFVKEVTGEILANRGEKLPISKLPDDGTFPVGTTKFEKRAIAENIPAWDPAVCIQCGDCSAVCPHAVIRMKVFEESTLKGAPAAFKSTDVGAVLKKDFPGQKFTIQVAPEDCTGCAACFNICPAYAKDANGQKTERKALTMTPLPQLREQEKKSWDFFLTIPYADREKAKKTTTIGSQILEPLFEFSGACAGCGETPYVKLLSQFFGDRAVIANATGCSSIYGGNLPTTPYVQRNNGKAGEPGPAWSNSLFEDAAEFGFGFRLTADQQQKYAFELVERALADNSTGIDSAVLSAIKGNDQASEPKIEEMRANVAKVKAAAKNSKSHLAKELASMADFLVKKSVWILGGDGWAYDIGFGGLDHVIAGDRNVNLLVMDTEVYSNTGGQMSKATPTGAIAKFAAGGKAVQKKDLAAIAMTYGSCYVAKVAMGYNRIQTLKAFQEAEAFPGPSLIIAYSHCIAHGFKDMQFGMDSQEMTVKTGLFPLFRYNPLLALEGKNPFQLDSKEPQVDALEAHIYGQNRFKQLKAQDAGAAAKYLESLKKEVGDNYKQLKYLADRPF